HPRRGGRRRTRSPARRHRCRARGNVRAARAPAWRARAGGRRIPRPARIAPRRPRTAAGPRRFDPHGPLHRGLRTTSATRPYRECLQGHGRCVPAQPHRRHRPGHRPHPRGVASPLRARRRPRRRHPRHRQHRARRTRATAGPGRDGGGHRGRQRALAQRDPRAQPAPAARRRCRASAVEGQRWRRARRRRHQRPGRARAQRRRPARPPRAHARPGARAPPAQSPAPRTHAHHRRRGHQVVANAESRADVAEAHALGAAGVGLYRTEFLFLQRNELPDEEEQFRAYRDVVLGMTGRSVTIRTLDLGADKADRTGLVLPYEPNPALGLRGVRLSLSRAPLFETQLRAIVRASGYGPVRVLVPMVSSREEVVAVAALLKRVARDLRSAGHEIAEHIPFGAMIEVPAAAIALPGFIDAVDFLYIGTNDLVQYLLAADRNNEALGELYSPLHPAVLRLLHGVIAIAVKRGKPVAVCGEMAGDAAFVPLLLALGLQEFSLHPATLLEVRRAIRGCDLHALRSRASLLLRARDRVGIERWLHSVPPRTA